MHGDAVRHDRVKYAFIWPAFIIVLVITIFPLIYALTVSFQSVRLVPPLPPRFVGVDNYAEILSSSRFWGSTWTTATIVFVSVAFQYVLGFLLALALHHNVRGSSLYRAVFLLPCSCAVCGADCSHGVPPYPARSATHGWAGFGNCRSHRTGLAIMVLISIAMAGPVRHAAHAGAYKACPVSLRGRRVS
ncbi:MAG: carbohydrate ABC transporter permease [Hyphomicrobiales bacterium]